ncbi:hypothetical protein FC87_GL000333 [Fructilactobacillus florum DSM 22689 = JCM 16035]|uniref:Uncharacterized protein n=1 Tax=Fructilactobacillus florum DSM 22689 = JCM 16035 TaxID=1423745 RepID=A0A0R2CDN8_9LACO|nr:hypothetical protein FC87_GL000333 [Fructilactobacillus florum DSM 22689 = JCM 16035]
MLITIVANILIIIFALKINADFMTKFIAETENRFDKKIELEKLVKNKMSK